MNGTQLQEKIEYVRQNAPAVIGRYERGAAIYCKNHIMTDQGDRVIVPSESRPGRCYSVQIDGRGHALCGCPDAQHGAPIVHGEHLCKHAIAAHLWKKNGPFENEN